MYRTIYKSSLQKIYRWPVVMMALSMLCAVILALTSNVVFAFAASIPGGNITDPAVRAVDIARPAVVRIFTEVSGLLTVNFSATNRVTFPQGSGKAYQEVLSGSGTFISSNGDVLTADHVVNPPAEALQKAAAQDVTNYIDSNPKLGLGQVTSDQVTQLLQSGQLQSSANFGLKKSEVFLSTDYTGSLSTTTMDQVPASIQAPVDRIEKESAVNQDDVAIVHASFTDTPSVQLGDSSMVQVQDQLNIIGFPGNGDVSNTNPTDLLTSSVNIINVSAVKTTDAGAPVIQVGGNVEQGDSGGPALDMSGNVVGIVSFGLAATAGSTSFLQASNSARSLIQSLNLNTNPGKFQTLWSQAFNDYGSTAPGHWHKAAQELQQLSTNYPQFKAVSKYLDYAQAQAKTEKVATATPTPTSVAGNGSKAPATNIMAMAGTVGAVLLVLLLVVLLFAVMIRQRHKKKRESGTVAAANKSVVTPPPVQNGQGNAVRPSGAPSQRSQAPVPPSPVQSRPGTGLQAFGAPLQQGQVPTTPPPVPSAQSGLRTQTPPQQTTAPLRIWPCGHMNRPNARFCSICGEPAPEPPTTTLR
jgi:Trypsin-like peptidase domain